MALLATNSTLGPGIAMMTNAVSANVSSCEVDGTRRLYPRDMAASEWLMRRWAAGTVAYVRDVAKVAGMLLAAGDGSRLGQPKATVELGGVTLAERGVALLRAGGTSPVVVVTGAVPVTIPGTRAVHNPDWATGMGSSLAAGLRALLARGATGSEDGDSANHSGIAAVVIALADQPLVGAEAVRRLIAAHERGAGVAVAAYPSTVWSP